VTEAAVPLSTASQPAEGSPAVPPDAEQPLQRLHPLSPVLHGAKSIVVIAAALSWQTLSQVGPAWFAVTVALLTAGVLLISLISWLSTGYRVVGRELRIHEGVLWRRTRAIPMERLQSVEVVRPLLAQLFGLAELRLEVVGGSKTEAPLAYLSILEAVALRERLLALADGRGHAATGEAAPATAPAPADRMLHVVANRDLVLSQLLTPQAFFLPFGVAFVAIQFLRDGSWSFIAVASTVTAVAGVVLQPIRRMLHDWDFRLASDDGRLRVRSGLLETRSQTVPLHRIQTVEVTWPLLWRPKGWLRMRMAVAGYAGPANAESLRSDRLLPVGAEATARKLLAAALPGCDLADLPTTPPPARARWVHPIAAGKLRAGLTDHVFISRSGLLTRELTVLPYARIQSVRLVQGPLQRWLRLATVYADTASGRSPAARDRDLAEARGLAAELTVRARRARTNAARPPATGPGAPAGTGASAPAPQPRTDGHCVVSDLGNGA
jgi:putative membrane protein